MKRKSIVVVLCLMLLMLLVGCRNEAVVIPEPSSTSEVVSEPVSEPVSEEVSEPVSEEPSEEVVAEPTDEEKIEEIMLGTYEKLPAVIDAMKEANISEPKLIVFGSNGEGLKEILANGDSCIMNDGGAFYLYCPGKVDEVSVGTSEVSAIDTRYDYSYGLSIVGQYTDLEVPVTITDVDGNVYELTFYVTKE